MVNKIHCYICVVFAYIPVFFFIICLAPEKALSNSLFNNIVLEDGVEHWYSDKKSNKSLLTQKFERLYNIIFSNSDGQPFGNSVAFLVGVGEYEHLTPQLSSVNNDLNQMRDFLLTSAGFDEIYIAKNKVVNRDLIEKYIKGLLNNKMDENDRLLFYYSGHGDDNKGNTGYMQFSRALKNTFYGQDVLAINDLEDWGSELRTKHILFILDCCASGLAFTAKSPADESGELLLKTLSGNGSRTVITAGTADEKTYEIQSREASGNGVFTKAFLNAFDSLSLSDSGSGLITISAIYAEIEKEMAKFRQAHGKATTPRLWKFQEMDYRGTFVFLNPRIDTAALTPQQADALGVKARGGTPDNETEKGIDYLRVDAEKITAQWFEAWQNKEVDMLVSLSTPPFFMDNELLLSVSDIRNRYQGVVNNQSPHGKIRVNRIMSGSIREYEDKGFVKKNDRLLTRLQLNKDDIVVIIIASTETLKEEGIGFYFRQTNKGVEMAGFWD